MSDRIPSAIAAKTNNAVDSLNTNATITNAINTIAETRSGLSISFCNATENSITAIGITTKNRIIVKTSIQNTTFPRIDLIK